MMFLFASFLLLGAVASDVHREDKGENATVSPDDFVSPPGVRAGPGPNGLARTPPMGWMSWERFRCEIDCRTYPDACINEKLYMVMADHFESDGYLDAGYQTISIDDCWERKSPPRDSKGRLAPEPTRFPSGLKALGDYLHKKGVQFGIYSDAGTKTCGGYPGSLHHEEIDAQTFADWGVDYLKYDGCYNNKQGYYTAYPDMGAALQKTGRNITYSCSWPAYLGSDEGSKPWKNMIDAGCNSWRNWGDIDNQWRSVSSIIDHWGDYTSALQAASGIGHWNDPDMMLCGDDHHGQVMSVDECKTQMSIWSIVAAPLIMSNDLRTVTKTYRDLIQNKEVIAVNQDKKGLAGGRVSRKGDTEVWARTVEGGVAVVLYNKNAHSGTKITASFTAVGFSGSSAKVRDLWAKKDLGTFSKEFSAAVNDNGVVMVKLTSA